MKKEELEWNQLEITSTDKPRLSPKFFLKQKKFFLPISLAFVATILQLFLLKSCQFIEKSSTDKKMQAILFSNKNIQKGESLNEENTKIIYFEAGDQTENFILNSEFQKFRDHPLKINLEKNSPLLKQFIEKEAKNLSLPEKIPYGKRFYGIEVDLASLPTLIKAGDRVDLIAHMDINGFGKATETILSGVKVVGIGNDRDEQFASQNTNILNFYLTPEEVKIISFMKPYSQFTVALRNPNDDSLSENSAVTFNNFIQNEKIQKIFKNDSFQIIEGKSLRKKE